MLGNRRQFQAGAVGPDNAVQNDETCRERDDGEAAFGSDERGGV